MHKKGFYVALAASITAGIVYSIKTLLLIFFPDYALQMCAYVWHVSPAGLSALKQYVVVTTPAFLAGLLHIMVHVFIIVLIFSLVLCAIRSCCGESKCCGCSCDGKSGYGNKPGCPPGASCK